MSDDDTAAPLFHPAPHGLNQAGLDLWFSVAEKYALRPDELTRLASACKTADMIAKLEAAWGEIGEKMTTRGSMGQEVIHPLIGELAKYRGALDRMLIGLKLPDLDADVPVVNQNRAAANESWKPGAARGRGA